MRAAYWKLRELDPRRYVWQLRRAVLLVRLRLLATWLHATLEVDIAPDVRLGRGLRVEIDPDTRNVLRVGTGTVIGDRVHLILRGGAILLGPRVQVRKDSTLNVAGRLEMGESSVFGYGCTIHCAESIVLEPLAGCAEQVTLADSSHYFTEPDEWFYDNVRTAPIHIGANTWLCPKVTVTSGVTIGSHAIVGANSVVHKDVPSGHLASGVPAMHHRPLDLPWRRTA
ncbi:MAG: acyltransferase [Actinomycetia bacterium]|nr:acyltransferase [Actinomycetes bacterium]